MKHKHTVKHEPNATDVLLADHGLHGICEVGAVLSVWGVMCPLVFSAYRSRFLEKFPCMAATLKLPLGDEGAQAEPSPG